MFRINIPFIYKFLLLSPITEKEADDRGERRGQGPSGQRG